MTPLKGFLSHFWDSTFVRIIQVQKSNLTARNDQTDITSNVERSVQDKWRFRFITSKAQSLLHCFNKVPEKERLSEANAIFWQTQANTSKPKQTRANQRHLQAKMRQFLAQKLKFRYQERRTGPEPGCSGSSLERRGRRSQSSGR